MREGGRGRKGEGGMEKGRKRLNKRGRKGEEEVRRRKEEWGERDVDGG